MKNVLVLGTPGKIEEFRLLQLKDANIDFHPMSDRDAMMMELSEGMMDEGEMNSLAEGLPDFSQYDVVFDLDLDLVPDSILLYMEQTHLTVFAGAVMTGLSEYVPRELVDSGMIPKLYGMNAVSTFIHRPLLEISTMDVDMKAHAESILKELGLNFEWVNDRRGMVTPRIVCMIINEAFFVLQEGTASIQDVDQSMRLRTNYPYGPFEWGQKIGFMNVVEILDSVADETNDPRYQVCPLLREYAAKDKMIYA